MHRPVRMYGPSATTAVPKTSLRFKMISRVSAVGAIAPSVRRAEIERVRRKRPDSLDAYDLVLQAQPDVDSGMPEQVTRALVLLDRAIALEPTYALAHGNAAMCHHCLFLRAGLQESTVLLRSVTPGRPLCMDKMMRSP